MEEFTADDRERVNHFDWWDTFPGVKAKGGFDIVVSNPPYVKLQNFRKVHIDMADYLREGRQGKSYYESTQTGNFDLYLPFIEKGLSLLNENGRMGYIAPSLWTMNDYGLGLRRLLARTRQLDRWVDFSSHQVFDEATTYTALQFYTGGSNEVVRISPAPDGDLTKVKWDDANCAVPYETLDPESAWVFLPKQELELIRKLRSSCQRLDNATLTSAIFQGLITSADSIYHLRRLRPGRYLCKPRGKGNDPYEVGIEDAIMKPLVSGPEAKRYIRPVTDTYLLFPYEVADGRATLISQHKMEQDFPDAWRYLKSYENDLRAREGNKFDDKQWYRFGRHQNLDKQNASKIIVPRLVTHLKGYLDVSGEFYLDNVDVGGVVQADTVDPLFLLALLNGPVSDWVFRRISKPFRGDYRSANRQFIAPLPIPECEEKSRRRISEKARALQDGYTKLRDLQNQRAHRLSSLKVRAKPVSWVFPDLGSVKDWEDDAPKTLEPSEHAQWAKDRYEEALDARYEKIARHFRPDAYLRAVFKNGELIYLIDKETVVDRVFLDNEDGLFIWAQWQQVADTFSMTGKTKGGALVNALRKVTTTDNAALRKQVIGLQYRITRLTAELWAQEKHMNDLLYEAYDLTEEERRLVEAG